MFYKSTSRERGVLGGQKQTFVSRSLNTLQIFTKTYFLKGGIDAKILTILSPWYPAPMKFLWNYLNKYFTLFVARIVCFLFQIENCSAYQSQALLSVIPQIKFSHHLLPKPWKCFFFFRFYWIWQFPHFQIEGEGLVQAAIIFFFIIRY